jgi:hypothetical protein
MDNTKCFTMLRTFLHPLFLGRGKYKMRESKTFFYVTDGNIMYLTDASRFLISCVIQHYAPVVGWGGMEEQMHNVDYDPGP